MVEFPRHPVVRDGVSVVVCCYNSAGRLPDTLRCLAEQSLREAVPCEVIVVDNASTDGTAQIAHASWPTSASISLRVVQEPKPGLSSARIRGFAVARYEFVSFIDDDNRVAKDWVAKVFARMSSDPQIGACGGLNIADLEGPPPKWWEGFQGNYAVGRQWSQDGDITQAKGYLYGAGLTVRKSAFELLRSNGFQFLTSDRRGAQLSGGGDVELCCALKGAGYKLWLDWDIQLKHFIPQQRLNWDYLRRMFRASGATSLILHHYGPRPPDTLMSAIRLQWWWQVAGTLRAIVTHPRDLIAYLLYPREGAAEVLATEGRLGRLAELFKLRGNFRRMGVAVRDAKWWGALQKSASAPTAPNQPFTALAMNSGP